MDRSRCPDDTGDEYTDSGRNAMSMHHWTRSLKMAGLALIAMAATVTAQTRDVPGPIDSLQDLQDTGRMLFKIVDENNDGQISQKEAVDAGNLIAGGFF